MGLQVGVCVVSICRADLLVVCAIEHVLHEDRASSVVNSNGGKVIARRQRYVASHRNVALT